MLNLIYKIGRAAFGVCIALSIAAYSPSRVCVQKSARWAETTLSPAGHSVFIQPVKPGRYLESAPYNGPFEAVPLAVRHLLAVDRETIAEITKFFSDKVLMLNVDARQISRGFIKKVFYRARRVIAPDKGMLLLPEAEGLLLRRCFKAKTGAVSEDLIDMVRAFSVSRSGSGASGPALSWLHDAAVLFDMVSMPQNVFNTVFLDESGMTSFGEWFMENKHAAMPRYLYDGVGRPDILKHDEHIVVINDGVLKKYVPPSRTVILRPEDIVGTSLEAAATAAPRKDVRREGGVSAKMPVAVLPDGNIAFYVRYIEKYLADNSIDSSL